MSLTPDQLAQLSLRLLARRAERELEDEPDERAALRKALMLQAALTQDSQGPAATQFARYILTSFKPLVSHLKRFDHDLWEGQTIGVRADKDGELVVAINRTVIDALMEEFAAEDNDVQRELILGVSADATASEADAEAESWPMTCERYVGFYDMMGFTSLVQRAGSDHSHLHLVMRRLHDASRLAEGMIARGNHATQTVSPTRKPCSQLKAVQFSDSIVAITRDASSASSLLIQMASQIFFLHALQSGVALRGAISCGIVTADFAHSIFFGQPIVDAYRLEETQEWYGVALHSDAHLADDEELASLQRDEIPLTETYRIPLKDQRAQEELSVVNWPVFADSLAALRKALRPFDGRGSDEPKKLAQYHKHTLAFAEAMWRKYRG